MNRIRHLFRDAHPGSRLTRRLQSARPGSVLILVVALLVLMALIGTAWLSTARTDRYSAQQNSYNTQVDLLLEAVKTLAKTAISSDVYLGGVHRPPPSLAPNANGYEHHDSPATGEDEFIASRVPKEDAGRAVWPFVGAAPSGMTLETPYRSPAAGGSPAQYPGNPRAEATVSWVTVPGMSEAQPAFEIGGFPYLAADADNDGIADSLLFRLTTGSLSEVTYYAAIRIVDNNSAVNPSVAWKPGDPADALPGQFFPTNIDLLGLLRTNTVDAATQMDALNAYRWNGGVIDPVNPYDDTNTLRTDFDFRTEPEAMWTQLGRRLLNPGYISPGVRFRSLPPDESLALAYRFCLTRTTATSVLENAARLGPSVFDGLRRDNDPYGAAEWETWYLENFNFLATAPNTMPIRALLAPRNAVSNAAPNRFAGGGKFVAGEEYPFGAWVQQTVGGRRRSYVSVRKTPSDPADPANVERWALMPWTTKPMKASVNVADFKELWLAYWSVMNERAAFANQHDAPFPAGADTGLGTSAPNTRKMFRNSARDPGITTSMVAAPAAGAAPVVQFPPYEMMRLRAALAAVNTIDLRDADKDVSTRELVLEAYVATPAGDRANLAEVAVMVYGHEPQVYITEVYANNNPSPPPLPDAGANARGYVAVELHNPHSLPFDLKNWNLGIIDRRREKTLAMAANPQSATLPNEVPVNPYGRMKIIPLPGFAGFNETDYPDAAKRTIPAGGHLVLESYDQDTPASGHRPPGSRQTPLFGPAPNHLFVPGLTEVLRDAAADPAKPGGELVLLRPRRGDGTLTDDTQGELFYEVNSGAVSVTDEVRSVSLADLVPADSYDFTDFTQAPAAGKVQAWHYVRANGPGALWKFVYPGRWDPNHPWKAGPAAGYAYVYRQEGTETTEWDELLETDPWAPATGPAPAPDPGTGPPPAPAANVPPINLGAADPTASYDNDFPGVQLSNLGMAGPSPAVAATGNLFPFGGFARNGDILQVPFIGAYRVKENDTSGAYVGKFLELNPITQDSAFAHDADTMYGDADQGPATASNDTEEQLGRFAPIQMANVTEDLKPVTTAATSYRWALDLFDHLTVFSPQNDYLPDVDSDTNELTGTSKYPGGPTEPVANGPSNNTALANEGREDKVGVEGLININTASPVVLATVPFLPAQDVFGFDTTNGTLDATANSVPDNRDVAEMIVYFRDVDADPAVAGLAPHGAFKNLFELNLVPGFQDMLGAHATTDFDDENGDLSPWNNPDDPPTPTTDAVVGDFEGEFLMMNRLSNLLTVRSDVFTVYVQLQGWRNVGSAAPELVVNRRAAFIADRNQLDQTNRSLTTVNVPTE